jgi:hypothetical protein
MEVTCTTGFCSGASPQTPGSAHLLLLELSFFIVGFHGKSTKYKNSVQTHLEDRRRLVVFLPWLVNTFFMSPTLIPTSNPSPTDPGVQRWDVEVRGRNAYFSKVSCQFYEV